MRTPIASLCFIALCACGGGGSGDDSPDAPPLPPPPPINAPGPAVLTFSGTSTARVIAESEAAQIADLASRAILTMRTPTLQIGIGDVPRDANGIVRTVVAGPGGGTLEYTGRIAPSGNGWVQYEYTNYVSGDVTLNGRQVREKLAPPTGYVSRTRVSGYDLRTSVGSAPSTNVTYNLLVDEEDGTGSQIITGEIQLSIGDSQPHLMIDSARIEFSVGPSNARLFNFSARIHDSSRGHVDVSTPTPAQYADNAGEHPIGGGPLLIRGAGNAAVQIQPLNAANVALVIDLSGDDLFERSVRLSSLEPYSAQVDLEGSGSPIAILGADRIVTADDEVPRLDGRYSTHGDGKFLSYSWRTVLAPPGGTVTISNPMHPRPTTTFSAPGVYRFELTVSDGTNSSIDDVDLVIGDESFTPAEFRIAALAPPDQHLTVGEAFELDAAPSAFAMPGTLSYSISVSNEQSQLEPVTMSGTVGRFVPAAPGVYRMNVRVTNQSPADQNTDSLWLFVDRSPLFAEPWKYLLSESGTLKTLLAADVSGDGRADLVEVSAPPLGTATPFTHLLAILRGVAGEAPLAPRTLLSSAVGREVVAGDINGDGRIDLVTTSAVGIKVFPQLPDGLLGEPIEFGNGSGCDDLPQSDLLGLSIADVNDDGLSDAIRLRSCGGDIEGFIQQPDGSLAGPVVLVPGAAGAMNRPRALADFNEDGRADLIVDAASGNFTLYRQLEAGGFAAGVPLDVGGSNGSSEQPVLCHGDANSDGRRDLIASAYGRTAVLLQSPTGELSAPSFIAMPPSPNVFGSPGECLVFDASGDGRADVYVQPRSATPFLLLQNANGSLDAPLVDVRGRAAATFGVRTLNLADIDQDGAPDLVYGGNHEIYVQTRID